MFQNKDNKNAKKHLDNAGNELCSAKDSVVSAAKTELRSAGDRAEEKVRDLRATAREAGEKVQSFLHERKDDAQHAKDSAERTIRANPIASAAVAFVTGAILSRLFRR
jgi:ElaB/YqjD/DUF883 family membrane-anchored ribosome-binding protein